MKNKFLLSCCFIFALFTKAYAQRIMEVDMKNPNCIHVLDGYISAPDEVPTEQLAHYEQAASSEKLQKLGFSNSKCVIVKSSADLDIENYIYRQVHAQVQQIGTQYKIPIVVNSKLIAAYQERRNQLSKLKTEQIKQITFLNKAEAQAKYGNKIVFGLIEIKI